MCLRYRQRDGIVHPVRNEIARLLLYIRIYNKSLFSLRA